MADDLTIQEIARVSRSPIVHLLAAIEAAEHRLEILTAEGKSPYTIAGAAAEEMGKILVAKRAYLESIGAAS